MNIYNQYLVAFIDSSLRDVRFSYFNFDNNKILKEYRNLDYELRRSSTQLTFIATLPKIFIESLFYIGILFSSMIALRQYDSYHGTQFTLTMLISVWICDSFAYTFGKLFGKKKRRYLLHQNFQKKR